MIRRFTCQNGKQKVPFEVVVLGLKQNVNDCDDIGVLLVDFIQLEGFQKDEDSQQSLLLGEQIVLEQVEEDIAGFEN